MIYLYAIAETQLLAATALPAGIAGARVLLEPFGDVWLAVSVVATRPVPSADQLWAHEGVIEALMQHTTVLPARFGTVAPDQDALLARLAPRQAAFSADIARVRGCVEVGVRVMARSVDSADVVSADAADAADLPNRTGSAVITTLPESQTIATGRNDRAGTIDRLPCPPAPLPPCPPHDDRSPTSGRDYIHQRLAAVQAQRAAEAAIQARMDAVHAPLAAVARAWVRKPAQGQLLMSAAYLVERSQLAAFQAACAAVCTEHPTVRVLGSGPWPAYNFVSAAARDALPTMELA